MKGQNLTIRDLPRIERPREKLLYITLRKKVDLKYESVLDKCIKCDTFVMEAREG